MELFYAQNLKANDEILEFSTEESRHLVKVLRKKPGDAVVVTNGNGLEWRGLISSLTTRSVLANRSDAVLHKNLHTPLHIAIAPTKSNDRLEWFLEKATEIGVTQITPIICSHSERKTIKPERMQKILVGALKQSAQFFLPKLHSVVNFDQFVQTQSATTKLLAHCHEGHKPALHQIKGLTKEVLIMIGPEGDFSEKEIKNAESNGFKSITLGLRRLRTETAGMVALSKINTLREMENTNQRYI